MNLDILAKELPISVSTLSIESKYPWREMRIRNVELSNSAIGIDINSKIKTHTIELKSWEPHF
jgi:hypothetical protein